MHVHFLDPYHHSHSPVHQLDGRVKFVLAVAFILTCSLTPVSAWAVYILLFALILSIEILSTLGAGYVLKRALLATPFVLAALPVIFTVEGIKLFSLPLGSWTLTASVEGLERFISIALKSWLSVQAAILLAAATPFPELLQAMRAVGIPRLLVAMFGLTWRYIFVLVDEALRLMRARAARSGVNPDLRPSTSLRTKREGGGIIWRAQVAGGMAGSLFLRGFERSDRIYTAMLSRGYDGEVRVMPLPALSGVSKLVLFAGLLLLGILLLFGILFWG
ncbi:Nickel transport protein NikQ [Anaerolineales bacterium]|nr:Nickel transport protein NikQ [Anaerolineales bacterium]